jgi:UDP-3-O-[3-hydroxymyristoyl] N-acetylglucosamine deacetylase
LLRNATLPFGAPVRPKDHARLPDHLQHTLARTAVCAGVAMHAGTRTRLVLRPAPVGHGIKFLRTDGAGQGAVIPAEAHRVTDTRLCTRLTNDEGISVATIEHLMAACLGLGVDNLLVELDGEELPILDGASALFCQLMMQAGLVAQSAPRRTLVVREAVEVRDGQKWARISPYDGFRLSVGISYEDPAIGDQTADFTLTPGAFVAELAYARTFGLLREVEWLQANGYARGGSMDNAVVVDGGAVLNPGGLLASNEFARHKVLDAVGDLALAGGRIEGHFEASRSGHALNNLLVRALLDTPGAAEWRELTPADLAAVA